MEEQTIFATMTPVFHDVMDNDSIVLTRELSAGDIEEWDSLSHIRLILAVEKAFHVRFSTLEIGELENLGQLVDLLQQKLP